MIFSLEDSAQGSSDGITKCCMPHLWGYFAVSNADRDGVQRGGARKLSTIKKFAKMVTVAVELEKAFGILTCQE